MSPRRLSPPSRKLIPRPCVRPARRRRRTATKAHAKRRFPRALSPPTAWIADGGEAMLKTPLFMRPPERPFLRRRTEKYPRRRTTATKAMQRNLARNGWNDGRCPGGNIALSRHRADDRRPTHRHLAGRRA